MTEPIMTELDRWIETATQQLSNDSANTVCCEIREHYEAAREEAVRGGADGDEAEFLAVRSLGDPRIASCQYRKVLLTAAEASFLRKSNNEARLICSTRWLKWAYLSAPGVLLLLSAVSAAVGDRAIANGLMMLGTFMAVLHIAPFLPIYTPVRGRIFRVVKWAILSGGVLLVFGRSALDWSWLLVCCFYPIFTTEWKRIMIRRKLPIGQWPKQLYL